MPDGVADEMEAGGAPRVIVRAARADDAPALVPLVAELGYPASAEQLQARLERLVNNDRVRVLLATNGKTGDVLGLCTVHLISTIHADRDVVQLTALVVSERARGTGVGRALVGEAEEWSRKQGAVRIVVTTALHRSGAHAFYERLGYAHTGRRYGRALV